MIIDRIIERDWKGLLENIIELAPWFVLATYANALVVGRFGLWASLLISVSFWTILMTIMVRVKEMRASWKRLAEHAFTVDTTLSYEVAKANTRLASVESILTQMYGYENLRRSPWSTRSHDAP